MKLQGDVPTATLVEKFGKVVSPSKLKLTITTWARSRKIIKLTKTAKQRRTGTKADIYRRTARALAYAYGKHPDDPDNAAFVADRLKELLDGTVNTTYWQQATTGSSIYNFSVPTVTPHPNPNPYKYRDQNNLPTKCTYPNGTANAAPLYYAGHTLNGYFQDDGWTWRDMVFQTPEAIEPEDIYPMILQATLTFTATADKRGSRPMFSVIYNVSYHDTNPDIANDRRPPMPGGRHLFYRYNPPTGVAPYYSATLQRKLLIVLSDRELATGTKYVRLRIGTRPMFGTGFNNNTTINVTATGTPRLYVAKRATQAFRRPCFSRSGTIVRLYKDNMYQWDDWALDTATRADYEGIPNYADQLRSHHNGIVITTPYAIIGSVFLSLNRYASYPYVEGIQILGSSYNGVIYTEGPHLDWQGTPIQSIVRMSDPYTGVTMYNGPPGPLAPFLAMNWVGGFSNNMLLTSTGDAYNQYLSSWTRPAVSGLRPLALNWANRAYMQDNSGQWWRFDMPTDRGGTLAAPQPGAAWPPHSKLGPPTLIADRPWPCAKGIMIPRPAGSPTTHHLLSWEGWLRPFDFPTDPDDQYMGTV